MNVHAYPDFKYFLCVLDILIWTLAKVPSTFSTYYIYCSIYIYIFYLFIYLFFYFYILIFFDCKIQCPAWPKAFDSNSALSNAEIFDLCVRRGGAAQSH